MKNRTLLVDADIFAYVASSATQKSYHFGGAEEAPSVAADLEQALEIASRDIEDVANKLKATKVIVCLTDDANFRHGVYPEYKGNRLEVQKPVNLKAVKDFYAANFETYQRPGLEADDCMGILSTHATLVSGEKIIVSTDKDMKTIPGLLYNPKKDKAPRRISELDADRYFMEQTLTGDATDGYPGCRGIGPKSPFVTELAEAKTLKDLWSIVIRGYASKKKTPEEALVQARCARILRASDWDFAGRRPRLWSPPVG